MVRFSILNEPDFQLIYVLSTYFDTQGEYYLDKVTGNLYVWMPSSSTGSPDVIYASMIDHCIWSVFRLYIILCRSKWATTWQNQQNDCAPSEDSDQPGHPPSLIRVFAVRLMGSLRPKFSSCGQRILWSDWADAQSSLGAQSFCWFCHVAA